MPGKPKSAFDLKVARAIPLQELQFTEPENPVSHTGEALLSVPRTPRKIWRKPRRPTRKTTLKELVRWLALPDTQTLRASADLGEIRLLQVTPQRFSGCMMDVARLNPRCLEEATPL